MLNLATFKVKRKASRYKRLLEKVSLYPFPMEISGQNYYLVDYVRLRQVRGTATLSDKDADEKALKKAFKQLFLFYRLWEKIMSEGRTLAKVNLKFYRTPLEVMDKHPHLKNSHGYAFIKELLAYQLTYKKTFDDFWNHFAQLEEKKASLTNKDLDFAIYTAAKLETLQDHLVYKLSLNTDILKEWVQLMKEENLWEDFKSDLKAFYLQLSQNEEGVKKEAKNIKDKDFNIALKINQSEMRHYMHHEQKREEKALRYP